MQLIGMFCAFFICSTLHASSIRLLDSDAFDQDNAEETAKIINQNFQELFNSKVSTGTIPLDTPSYFVYDFLNPEMADQNCFSIMSDADDLYNSKLSIDGSPRERAYFLTDLLNPDTMDQTIATINEIFINLDDDLSEQ